MLIFRHAFQGQIPLTLSACSVESLICLNSVGGYYTERRGRTSKLRVNEEAGKEQMVSQVSSTSWRGERLDTHVMQPHACSGQHFLVKRLEGGPMHQRSV